MATYYILDECFTPVPCADVMEWSNWHRTNQDMADTGYRRWTDGEKRTITISTRFFGTDLDGLRCMWETVVLIDDVPQHEMTLRTERHEVATANHRAHVDFMHDHYPENK